MIKIFEGYPKFQYEDMEIYPTEDRCGESLSLLGELAELNIEAKKVRITVEILDQEGEKK